MRNLPQRLNNPIDLRFASQKEATQDASGFAAFPTPEAGWRAAFHQIALDTARGLTLGQFLSKFAPPSENKTAEYLNFICNELKVSGTVPLKELSGYVLAMVLAVREGYFAQEKEER